MRTARKYRQLWSFGLLTIGAVLSVGVQGVATAATAHPAVPSRPAATAHPAIAHPGTVKPRSVGELDCNGLRPMSTGIAAGSSGTC
jgi:hypothetical protein